MFIKNDSNLSIFISDLRKLEGRERTIKALAERRKMIDCNKKNLEQSNVLKMIYFAINQQEIDTMLFIKAIGSLEFITKKYGYLGLLLGDDEEYFILTLNTLMKDLQNKKNRELALTFLCNVKIRNNIFNDLAGFICTRNINDKLIVKSTIAKNKITVNEKISLIGNNENLIFTKIQILIDRLLMNENVNMMDNDKSFLYAYYGTTSNSFLKVKLIQLYKLLNDKNRSKSFFHCLERDIILPHESVKPLVDISLSIEIVDLFLSISNATQKVESFLFRLIDSQNPNSRYMGFKLAMKYKMFCNHVIDRSIKWGLHNADCYEALMFFINKSTHKEIYKRKEEIMFMMDKQNIKESVSRNIVTNIIIKVLEYAKDELYLKIYYENPEICFINEINRKISDELRLIYFNKLLQKTKIKYFHLLYSLLPKNYKKSENLDKKLENYEESKFYEELFENHLNILIKNTKKGPRILEKLIMAYAYFDKLDFYRDMLVEKYYEVSIGYKQVIRDGVYLMNSKCNNKTLLLEQGIVLKYSLLTNLLRVEIKGDVECVEVQNKKEKLKRKNEYVEKEYVEKEFGVFEFEMALSQDVMLTFTSKNKKHTQNLYF